MDSYQFRDTVKAFVAAGDLRDKVLAEEFEVAESTVARWATGHARPNWRVMREIVAFIERYVDALEQS